MHSNTFSAHHAVDTSFSTTEQATISSTAINTRAFGNPDGFAKRANHVPPTQHLLYPELCTMHDRVNRWQRHELIVNPKPKSPKHISAVCILERTVNEMLSMTHGVSGEPAGSRLSACSSVRRDKLRTKVKRTAPHPDELPDPADVFQDVGRL